MVFFKPTTGTLRCSGRVAFGLGWLVPCVAWASIRVDSRFVQRDLMLILVACLTLLLFYLICGGGSRVRLLPLGRRTEDISQERRKALTALEHLWSQDSAWISWDPVRIDAFVAAQSNPRFWYIDLFEVSLAESIQPVEPLPSFFPFAETIDEADNIISPIMRKIYAKYREQFEIASPIAVVTDVSEDICVTWLPHEGAIRGAVFGFLDEVLNISRELDASPSLEICRGTRFSLTVTWPKVEWVENFHVFEKLYRGHEGVEVLSTPERIGLCLHISFKKSEVPSVIWGAIQSAS